MKRNISSAIGATFIVLTILTSMAHAQSFNSALDWIDRFRQGEGVELQILVQPNTFSVSREQVTNINKVTFDQLLSGSRSRGTPLLRLTPEAEVFVYRLSGTLELRELVWRHPSTQGGPKAWEKRELIPIATYPSNQWGAFLTEALSHGLTEYNESDIVGRPVVTLHFKQIGPSRFQSGTKSLALSDEFYGFMKLDENHKPVADAGGFVVLVHEPHSSVSGQFQLIPGLKALLSANKHHQFVFLVEGEYEGPSTDIGFNSLDSTLDQARGPWPAEPLVYNMLSRYLIDGPLAYRLLYDRTLPAFAIDDLRYLENVPYGSSPQSRLKERRAVFNILTAAQNVRLPATEAKEASQKLIEGLAYTFADVGDLRGELYLDYYTKLPERLSAVVTVAERFKQVDPSIQINSDITLLKSQIQSYQSQRKIYENAIRRDVMMAEHISTYAKSTTGRIPLAFIGGFHTDGITKRLRSQNIGYVVIEPRFSVLQSPKEKEDFDRALYQSTREDYLRVLGRRKLRVNAASREVTMYYRPYLTREAKTIAEQRKASAINFSQLTARQVDDKALNDALVENGALAGAQVVWGGAGGSNVPPGFGKSFAFLEPGGDGRNPRFVVVDPNDSRWNKARYNCLRQIKLNRPYQEEDIAPRRKLTFYPDQESKLLYASIFDPQSGRFYLLEGKEAISATLGQLILPKPKENQDIRIRMQLSELERFIQRRMKKNG